MALASGYNLLRTKEVVLLGMSFWKNLFTIQVAAQLKKDASSPGLRLGRHDSFKQTQFNSLSRTYKQNWDKRYKSCDEVNGWWDE